MGGCINVVQFPAGNNTLEINAKNQVIDESGNLFVLSGCDLDDEVNNIQRYIDVKYNINNSLYRCYLVPIQKTEYYANLSKLFGDNKFVYSRIKRIQDPNETVNIARFYLKDIFDQIDNNPNNVIKVKNTDGFECTLSERASNILRNIRKNNELITSIFMNPYILDYKIIPYENYQLNTFVL